MVANLHELDCLKPQQVPEIPFAMNTAKTIIVNLDANHEFQGLMKELIYYAPFVTLNSYLIVQDAKLDKIWGTAGPTAALNAFLQLSPPGEFLVEEDLKFHGYSQHIYVRRAQVTVPHSYFLQVAMEAMRSP